MCLTDLNEVELAMIAPARTNKHIFSFTAGSHKSIRGWHSLYYNDLDAVNGVVNWCNEATTRRHQQGESNDSLGGEENAEKKLYIPTIAVVLCGPFTSSQRAKVREKTEVRWEKMQNALLWLKANNPLYAEYDLPTDAMLKPIFLDKAEIVPESSSNVELVFEINAVFPDSDEPKTGNGGFATQQEFRNASVENLVTPESDKQATLISRPTPHLLRDYEGDNLIRAFPLQFPYGIGGRNSEGESRQGVGYLKHLSMLAPSRFHGAAFICVLHNMFERKRMVANTFLRVSDSQAQSFPDISTEAIEEALRMMQDNVSCSTPGYMFLQKLRAITSSMGHTSGAAKRARQRMFSMISHHGLPSLLFTITPEDAINYRIRVMSTDGTGERPPPDPFTCDFSELAKYAKECKEIRVDNPGLCAFDFENVLRITIAHLIGWDETEQKNKPCFGIFGDISGWCYAVEEQGRKTLHAHFLLWVKDWAKLLNGLSDESLRDTFKKQMEKYVSAVSSAELHGNDCQPVCTNDGCSGSVLEHCSAQDLRNLRTRAGKTAFGGKQIMKCGTCDKGYSSEDLVKILLDPMFSLQGGDDEPFWPHVSSQHTKYQLLMEFALMRHNHPFVPKILDDKQAARFVAALRNLHNSNHCTACFKKGGECRMKIPNLPFEKTTLVFDEHYTNWYDWKGNNRARQLFHVGHKRSRADVMMNIHNRAASNLFACNTNVVAGVDGGSVMYMTCYVSKNTQNEDNEHFASAAKHMVRKMKTYLSNDLGVNENRENNTADTDNDRVLHGMRGLIGAVLLSTGAHVCSAPMAAFLLRNESRFGFSHEFAYVDLRDFESDKLEKFSCDAYDGEVFLKSSVADYLYRPHDLEGVCLYDFLCSYSVGRATSKNRGMEWVAEHPSRGNLVLKKNKKDKIPLISFLDFVDTKFFGDRSIDNVDASGDVVLDSGLAAMESYAKKACLLFYPFRQTGDLRSGNRRYLGKFQQGLAGGIILKQHLTVLSNIQDCRNSLNCGRPSDSLERVTQQPSLVVGDASDSEEECETGIDPGMDAVFDELISCLDVSPPLLRNADGLLAVDSRFIRSCGTNKCGENLVVCPELPDSSPSVFRVSFDEQADSATFVQHASVDEKVFESRRITYRSLHELSVRFRERVMGVDANSHLQATGTLENIRAYADVCFRSDVDQKRAFESIVAAFVLELYKEANRTQAAADSEDELEANHQNTRFLSLRKKELEKVNRGHQYIAFLSGAGGTGKSHVLKSVVRYAKSMCRNLSVKYDKRTIVVTALTGAAAVGINGETTHNACAINREVDGEVEEWTNAYMLVVDEISFASKDVLISLHHKLRENKENATARYGGIPVLFAGDFTQLKPVKGYPLFVYKDLEHWYEWVHTFMELRTNHRFVDDPDYGELLSRYRDIGPDAIDLDTLNTRVVGSPRGPRESDIPSTADYATKSNIDRAAINDAIFCKHLTETHSKDPERDPPLHTICVRASDLRWKKPKTRRDYVDFNSASKDMLYAYCGEGHVKSKDNKHYDPLLKFYYGRPLMINDNIDVERCVANGAMCTFREVVLMPGVTVGDMEKICIDGYFVWCVSVSQVQSLRVTMQDGVEGFVVNLEATKVTATVQFLLPEFGRNVRIKKTMRLKQFPINVSNARTGHKLQGRSLRHLVISSWDYTDNWVYVCLSRCATLNGLFLRQPLNLDKTRGISEECARFYELFRETKQLPEKVVLFEEERG